MKKLFLLGVGIYFLAQIGSLNAQVAINETGAASTETTAILEISSTTKGVIIPRMTSSEMGEITTPANGLIVYNTTDGCLNYYSTGDATWHSFVITGSSSEVSIGAGGNTTTIETDGTLEFNGNATVWNDFVISPAIKASQNNGPDWVDFKGNIKALAFDGGSQMGQVFFDVQMPHGWVEESTIYPHIHWAPSTTGSGNVIWYLEYTWANYLGTFPTPTVINSGAVAAGGTPFKLLISSMPSSGGIDATGKTISSVLRCRLYRTPTGSDTYGDDAFILSIDFHYETNTVGSRTEYIK